jgi:hypothetical protein
MEFAANLLKCSGNRRSDLSEASPHVPFGHLILVSGIAPESFSKVRE